MGLKGIPVEGAVWLANRMFQGKTALPLAPKEILVLRPNDFGDLLTTTPIFEALRRRFPSTRLIAAVGGWGRPLLDHNPFVSEVVDLDAPWNNKVVKDQSWAAAYRFIKESEQVRLLRERGGFDVGIDVLGSHVGAALMMRLGIRYKVGVRGYRGGWSACDRYINFSTKVHVSRAALAQAELLGAKDLPEARPQIFLSDSERTEAARLWGRRPSPTHIRVLVGSGGGLEEKCWSPEAWGQAIAGFMAYAASKYRTVEVLLVGGPTDRERAARVLSTSGSGPRSVCGETSLRTTFALAEQADLVLTNPSMLLHVAAAFRRPTVAVLGGIYSDPLEHDILWGYPEPYSSVASKTPGSWPAVDDVLTEIIARAQI